MSDEQKMDVDRRRLLQSVSGALAGAALPATGGAGQLIEASEDSNETDERCQAVGFTESSSESGPGAAAEPTTAGWPAALTGQSFVESVEFPAHSVVTLSARGPVTEGCTPDVSPFRDELCLDSGDDYDVAVFWGELSGGLLGAAIVGPYAIHDPDGEEYLPRSCDSADSWIILNSDSNGVYPDAYTYFHELGHTLGYSHSDCGIMTTSGCTGPLTDADYGNDLDGGTYLTETTVEIARASPHLRYTEAWSLLQTAHIDALFEEDPIAEQLESDAATIDRVTGNPQPGDSLSVTGTGGPSTRQISRGEAEFAQEELSSETAEAVYLLDGWLQTSGFNKQFGDELTPQSAGLYLGMMTNGDGSNSAVNSLPFNAHIDQSLYDNGHLEIGALPPDHPVLPCEERDDHPFCSH